MEEQDALDRAARSVADVLNSITPGWHATGHTARGTGAATVIVKPDHDQPIVIRRREWMAHIAFGFLLDPDDGQAPVFWDCASGLASTAEESLDTAINAWSTTTAPVLLELLNQTGALAEHLRPPSPLALPGYHAIRGPIQAGGRGQGVQALAEWCNSYPILPSLASDLIAGLTRPSLNGIKFYFGSVGEDLISEVRINHEVDPACSRALAALPWPRPQDIGFVRSFAVITHPDNPHWRGGVPSTSSVPAQRRSWPALPYTQKS